MPTLYLFCRFLKKINSFLLYTLCICPIIFFASVSVRCRSFDKLDIKMGCEVNTSTMSLRKNTFAAFLTAVALFSLLLFYELRNLTSHLQIEVKTVFITVQKNKTKPTLFRELKKFQMFSFGLVRRRNFAQNHPGFGRGLWFLFFKISNCF